VLPWDSAVAKLPACSSSSLVIRGICDAVAFGELAHVRQPTNRKQVMPCLKHDQVQPRGRSQGFHAWGAAAWVITLIQTAMKRGSQFAFRSDPIVDGAMAGLGDRQDLIPALIDGLSGGLEYGGAVATAMAGPVSKAIPSPLPEALAGLSNTEPAGSAAAASQDRPWRARPRWPPAARRAKHLEVLGGCVA